MIGLVMALILWRQIRAQRREQRLRQRIEKLHASQPDLPMIISHFWLGAILARYGSDQQLDDWYRLTQGMSESPFPHPQVMDGYPLGKEEKAITDRVANGPKG